MGVVAREATSDGDALSSTMNLIGNEGNNITNPFYTTKDYRIKISQETIRGLAGIGGSMVLVTTCATGQLEIVAVVAHVAAVTIDGILFWNEIQEFRQIPNPENSDWIKLSVSGLDFFGALSPALAVPATINQLVNSNDGYDSFYKKFNH